MLNQLLSHAPAKPPWFTVPFWLSFNAQPSARGLQEYLMGTNPYDEIYLLPFSNGVAGPGFATEADLEEVLNLARKKGEFLGATPQKYPFDFGIYARYEKALKHKISSRYDAEKKLSLEQLHAFIQQAAGRYKVSWPQQDEKSSGML